MHNFFVHINNPVLKFGVQNPRVTLTAKIVIVFLQTLQGHAVFAKTAESHGIIIIYRQEHFSLQSQIPVRIS